MKRTFLRGAVALLVACAVTLGAVGFLNSRASVALAADAGFSSTPQPNIHPLASGGYYVQTLAVTNEDASVNILAAPNPSIDWGDGSTSTIPSGPNEDPGVIQYVANKGPDNCTASGSGGLLVYGPGGPCSFDLPLTAGGSLTGGHTYTQAGTYTITAKYYTGCCIYYSTQWSVVIPGAPTSPTTDTLNLTVLQVDASPYAGASGVIQYSPASNEGATACPPTCNPTWPSGTTVSLTAAPAAGSAFAYWTSLQCGKGGCVQNCPRSTNPCSVTLPQLANWAESDAIVFQLIPDSAPPAITASATTADGQPYTAGTWTNQDVTVRFTCADTGAVQSGIGANTVTGATVSGEGASQSVTSAGACVDKAGKSASPVTFGPIQIDKTKPTITASATTADGQTYIANAWTNQDVTVRFTCAENGSVQSGIATNTVAGATLTSETASQSLANTGACVDSAGNAADATTFGPVRIDMTKPVITGSATTADGTSYLAGAWTNQDVTVAFACAENGAVQSGIATNTVAGQTLTSETAGQMVANSGACDDNAGNAADAASFGPVRIDKTKPSISATATTADGKPYIAGSWTNQSVTVSFTCADIGDTQSGIASNTVAGQTLTAETPQAGQSVTNTGACADNAGNIANAATFGPILIDKTAPTLVCLPSENEIWPPNHMFDPVTTSVQVTDGLSGAAGFTLVSTSASGSPSDIQGFDASSPTSGLLQANKDETYTLTYQGADLAGNTATCVVTVIVPHDQRAAKLEANF